MAGMRGLGRVYDVVPVAASVYVSMKNCSAVAFICTAADTFTIKEAKTSSGGSAQNVGAVVTQYYQNTSTVGAAGWTLQTQAAGHAVIQASAYTTIIEIFGDMLDDGYDYVECVPTGAGLVTAVCHDLTYQRKPANLQTLNA